MAKCRLTGSDLIPVLDLGMQPLGNGFLTREQFPDEYFFHLECGFSEDSRLFQLLEQPAPELMFHDDYAFFSGTSRRMAQHFEQFAESVRAKGFVDGDDPFVVELGSNDGIYLAHFAKAGMRHLGIEPSGKVADVAEQQGIAVLREFFDSEVANRVRDEFGPADVVSAANVMCHIPDVHELARGIELLLKPNGVLIFEDPYLGDVVRLTSFDQIYDEHVFLFSALSVQRIFAEVGMELIAVEHQTTHGGSMRYTVAKIGQRPVADSVTKTLVAEMNQGLHRTETFVAFAERVRESGQLLKSTLVDLAVQGKVIASYGATSKSATIFNYADIGPSLVQYICDNTPLKIGKVSPGMHIPVVDEQVFLNDPPDVAFMGAWNHEREIRSRNAAFESAGGRWVSHVPGVRFLD